VVQSVVNRAFDRLAQEVERHGGLLEKFMGDAILAVFGIPTAHRDDPEGAVRAAIEMQAVLGELNRGFAAENKPGLEMRIGSRPERFSLTSNAPAAPASACSPGTP